jgi:hypothetical protein
LVNHGTEPKHFEKHSSVSPVRPAKLPLKHSRESGAGTVEAGQEKRSSGFRPFRYSPHSFEENSNIALESQGADGTLETFKKR